LIGNKSVTLTTDDLGDSCKTMVLLYFVDYEIAVVYAHVEKPLPVLIDANCCNR